jgi:phosphate/phosphite/phosphonate ABC transporter binding protein
VKRTALLTLILTSAFVLANCTLPRVSLTQATETPTPEVTPTDTPPPPLPTAELGLVENPLILALPPSANSPEQIEAANLIAALFTERTGYAVVTIAPDSYTALVEAFDMGNAHIALLDPYSYTLAYKNGTVRAVYAVIKDGKTTYGAQFIATRRGGFTSRFDPASEENTTDARAALQQFNDKKACWSDETSPSGYVIPLGFLNRNEVFIRPSAFVEGHPTVVRSLYAGGICDFGATYIDARKFPSLEDEFPDLMENVIVVWRIPEIIPYDVLAFSTNMPQPMRDLFANMTAALMQTDAGRAAFQTAYGIEELLAVNDAFYAEFREYVDESRIELSKLVR